MTALAIGPESAGSSVVATLIERNRALAFYGCAMLVFAVIAIAAQAIDTRTLESRVGVWVKPAKFFFSVGIFALTAAWFFGYIRLDRRRSRSMRATATVLMTSTVTIVATSSVAVKVASAIEPSYTGFGG